jgi:hypothetical protein
MAKPRPPQSKMAALPAEQLEKVHEWFRENLTYREIKARVQSEFGVSIGESSLCDYYRLHSFEIFKRPCKAIDLEDSSIDIRAVSLAPGSEIQIRLQNGWIALRAVRPAPPVLAALLKEEELAA